MRPTIANSLDVAAALNGLLDPIGLSSTATGGTITITGQDPIVSSGYPRNRAPQMASTISRNSGLRRRALTLAL
jgi:hypothetical protein